MKKIRTNIGLMLLCVVIGFAAILLALIVVSTWKDGLFSDLSALAVLLLSMTTAATLSFHIGRLYGENLYKKKEEEYYRSKEDYFYGE